MWAWGFVSAANSRVTRLLWAEMSLAAVPYSLCDDEIIFIPWHWMRSGSSDVLALQPSAEEAPEPLGGLFSWLAASCSSEDHLSYLVVASELSWEGNLSSCRPNTHTGVMKRPQGQTLAAAVGDDRPDLLLLTFFIILRWNDSVTGLKKTTFITYLDMHICSI